MSKSFLPVILLGLALCLNGCGQISSSPSGSEPDESKATPPPAAPLPASDGPHAHLGGSYYLRHDKTNEKNLEICSWHDAPKGECQTRIPSILKGKIKAVGANGDFIIIKLRANAPSDITRYYVINLASKDPTISHIFGPLDDKGLSDLKANNSIPELNAQLPQLQAHS
jgi:hypothetical protein